MAKVKNWVTASEVEALRKAARKTRNPARNELAILMLYRHGLRVSELCKIQLEQLNLEQSTLFVKRSKNGIDGMHPLAGDELRLLRRYLRKRVSELPWLFLSERGTPFARSTVNKLLEQCSDAAALLRVNAQTGESILERNYNEFGQIQAIRCDNDRLIFSLEKTSGVVSSFEISYSPSYFGGFFKEMPTDIKSVSQLSLGYLSDGLPYLTAEDFRDDTVECIYLKEEDFGNTCPDQDEDR